MNWVGGARSRIKMRDELTKQKEYFEKKRYRNKVRRLEKPASPRKRTLPVSTDLLSLQAATFSAKKFSTKDSSSPIKQKITKVDLDQSRSSLLPFRRLDDVELPMSPGESSKLLLQEANSSTSEEVVNSNARKLEPPLSFLNTQKQLVEKKQALPTIYENASEPTLSQMSSQLSTKHEICLEKFESSYANFSMKRETKMKPKPTPHNFYASQQYQPTNRTPHQFYASQHCQPRKPQGETPRLEEKRPDRAFHKRAPENLFFEFLPQAMSTLKRPPLDEESGAETSERSRYSSPMSHKSDNSCMSPYQSTLSQDEDSLVPQGNPSSPATSASSPYWQAASITSYDISSDNLDRGLGSRSAPSTGGEDTPHQSDSSLTSFRQYYRKKLNTHANPDTDHDPSALNESKTSNLTVTHRGRVDLKCHEVISPILPVEESSSMQTPFKNQEADNLPQSQDSDVLLIQDDQNILEQCSDYNQQQGDVFSKSICKDKDEIDGPHMSKGLDIAQTVVQRPLVQVNENQKMLKSMYDMMSASGTNHAGDVNSYADLTRHALQKNDPKAKKTTDKTATEWKDFLGGTGNTDTEEEMDGTKDQLDRDDVEESSQGSCASDEDNNRLNVTNEVLFEVLELDKKINQNLSSSSSDTKNGCKQPDKSLETFDSGGYLHQLEQQQKLIDHTMKLDSLPFAKETKKDTDSSISNMIKKPQDHGEKPRSESKRLIMSADKEKFINSSSSKEAMQENRATAGESGLDIVETDTVKVNPDTETISFEQQNHILAELGKVWGYPERLDKETQCQLQTNANTQDAATTTAAIEVKQNQVATQTDTHTDDAISSETKIVDLVDVGVQSLQRTECLITQTDTQIDLENIGVQSSKCLVDLGVQCDTTRPAITLTRKRVDTVAGGQINGRQDKPMDLQRIVMFVACHRDVNFLRSCQCLCI